MKDYFASFSSMKGINPVDGVILKSVHLDNVMLTWVEFEPETILPEHSHPHEQISLIVEGRLEFTIENKTQVMEKGDSVVVPPNARHSARTLDLNAVVVDAWNPVREDYKM